MTAAKWRRERSELMGMDAFRNPSAIYVAECPGCNRAVDMTACVTENGARPKDGDLSVCFYCETVSLWAEGQTRLDRFDLMSADEGTRAAINGAIAQLRARKGVV